MSWLAVLLPVIALGTVPVAAVPPPPDQVQANCEAPTYASDMLVCADSFLRALDSRMSEAWDAVDFASVAAPGAWVEAQNAWFRRRSLCAFSERHADCLQAAYVERIAVLQALGRVALRPKRQGLHASCNGAPWGHSRVRVRAPELGALTLEAGATQVLAAATPAAPVGAWVPYVGFEVDGSTIRLTTQEGTTIVCTLVVPH
jgi:uncharacterized protein YecT (DUF1311 family)